LEPFHFGAKEGEDLIRYLAGWLCRRLWSDLSIAVESYLRSKKKLPPPQTRFTLLPAESVSLITKETQRGESWSKGTAQGQEKK